VEINAIIQWGVKKAGKGFRCTIHLILSLPELVFGGIVELEHSSEKVLMVFILQLTWVSGAAIPRMISIGPIDCDK
jgi:hypothetical protein